MKPHAHKPKPAERQPDLEDMTMHDVAAMFFITGLLASGKLDKDEDHAVHLGSELAKTFINLRKENL